MISRKRLAQTQNHKCKNTFFFLYLSLLFFCCCLDVWNIWTHEDYIYNNNRSFCSDIDFFSFKKEEPKVQLCFDLIMWFSHVSYPVIPADVRYVRKEKIVIQVNWLMTITLLHIWCNVCICMRMHAFEYPKNTRQQFEWVSERGVCFDT